MSLVAAEVQRQPRVRRGGRAFHACAGAEGPKQTHRVWGVGERERDIYIYIEREGFMQVERERERERGGEIEREREGEIERERERVT